MGSHLVVTRNEGNDMTKANLNDSKIGTTNKILTKMSRMILGHEESVTRTGKKVKAVKECFDVKDVATLSNAYGYLLNVNSNVKKTHMIDVRLKELEALAITTQRLIPDSKQRQNIPTVR